MDAPAIDSVRRPRRPSRLALCLALLAFASCKAKGAAGPCPDLACGPDPGSPVGMWKVVDVCTFPVPTRPTQNYDSTRGYFQPETGATPPAQVSGPWCWDLSFDKDGNLST